RRLRLGCQREEKAESHQGKHAKGNAHVAYAKPARTAATRKFSKGLFFCLFAVVLAAPAATRETTSFDAGWRFLKADAPGAEKADFDEKPWRAVDLPHDWSIEGPFDAKNPTGGAGGFLPAGVGWYRKHFVLPTEDASRRVYVEFDGVMANSDVW